MPAPPLPAPQVRPELVAIDSRSGAVVQVLYTATPDERFDGLTFAPDRRTIVFGLRKATGECSARLMALTAAGLHQIAFGIRPSISSDGKYVAYVSLTLTTKGECTENSVAVFEPATGTQFAVDLDQLPLLSVTRPHTVTNLRWAPNNVQFAADWKYPEAAGSVVVVDLKTRSARTVQIDQQAATTAGNRFAPNRTLVALLGWRRDGILLVAAVCDCGLSPSTPPSLALIAQGDDVAKLLSEPLVVFGKPLSNPRDLASYLATDNGRSLKKSTSTDALTIESAATAPVDLGSASYAAWPANLQFLPL